MCFALPTIVSSAAAQKTDMMTVLSTANNLFTWSPLDSVKIAVLNNVMAQQWNITAVRVNVHQLHRCTERT